MTHATSSAPRTASSPLSPISHRDHPLRQIEQRVLWLATSIVHHANHVRPNTSGVKVGGHQASSASIATIMTSLWFEQLRSEDRVSVKPHASPVLHAINYLLGNLEETYLTTLREFGGLQSYPSRTKDPDPVDYSTGSVGIGATAPIWGAISRRYTETLTGTSNRGRQYSLLDDNTGVETTIEAHYNAEEGRYIVTAIINRAVREDFDQQALRRTASVAILQAAIPHCIAVRLTDEPGDAWTSIADLTSTEGRIIPPWMAAAAVKRGMKDERMEVIEILYGAAALSGTPPVRAVQVELDIPHRTASDWIKKARDAGRLEGMTYNVGRQADG